jgi:hypothetical protein
MVRLLQVAWARIIASIASWDIHPMSDTAELHFSTAEAP